MFKWLFKRQSAAATERRSIFTGSYTADTLAVRSGLLAGTAGIAELTATVQSCISLWEGAFQLADVTGTDLLTRQIMGLVARGLALRGDVLLLITQDGLVPLSNWQVATRMGKPVAYRGMVPDANGGQMVTCLADEVLHIRIGADPLTPWAGTGPLTRSTLTASLLDVLETALRDVYRDAPLGSQIIPLPEGSADDIANMRTTFTGKRGASLVIEGVAQATAAGMNPNIGKAPDQLSPDLSRSMTAQSLDAARNSILMAYGVLPGLHSATSTGPLVREAQRHLAGWVLQPICELMAAEARDKLGLDVTIDVGRPLQAFDAGGRARALGALVEAMGRVKELGLSPDQFNQALLAVNWGGGDNAA